MARLVGKAVVGAPGEAHTTQQNPLGMECPATDSAGQHGAVCVYLKAASGIAASTAEGSWVVYDENGECILLDTDLVDQGNIAVATGVVAAGEYGWFYVKGMDVNGLALTALADNALVFATSTGGSIDDADTGVGYVHGALSRSVVNETTLLATFQIDRPFVTGADLPN